MKKIDKNRYFLMYLMADVIKRNWPNVKLASGSLTENGFYYDFDFENKINEEDLFKIEEEMKKLAEKETKIEIKKISRIDAKKIFKKDPYKLKIIKNSKKIFICETRNFVDVCDNVPFANSIKVKIPKNSFKITEIAGAYWKGNKKNKMLTRIYGIAFNNEESLKKFIILKEELEQRDHRKIGKDLDLFHLDEKVGLGLPLWHPKGAILWREIENFWYNEHFKNGYELVRSPHIGNRMLWEISGHWNFYNENMYPSLEVGQTLKNKQDNEKILESEEYLLKPMNCPFHVQIYKSKPRSYRDLPFRWAECGTVYRYEKKGELSGLTRLRGFTQDDAHIICCIDQVEEEIRNVIDFILFIFNSFGFKQDTINVYLSLKGNNKKNKYIGSEKKWHLAEKVLRDVAKEKKIYFTEEEGEAAFYGPKLDFKLKDVVGREWQCSTLQFDFNLPERFDMYYINSNGEKERPYMIHRALFGSFERFIALIIENYKGSFPLWLSPTQIKLVPVGENYIDYCQSLSKDFNNLGIRSEIDSSDETVGNKIRKSVIEKVPYILVIGEKEIKSGFLSVRERNRKEIRKIKKQLFIKEIKEKIKTKEN